MKGKGGESVAGGRKEERRESIGVREFMNGVIVEVKEGTVYVRT